jgi:hypothetical protein
MLSSSLSINHFAGLSLGISTHRNSFRHQSTGMNLLQAKKLSSG